MPAGDVVVIGAGQAGLSSAHVLRERGFAPDDGFAVLDANPAPGGAWQHRWPSLRLGTVHRLHPLPGMALDEADPSVPASEVVADYYARYERAFDLRVHRPVSVRAVRPVDGALLAVETSAGTWTARALINATGTWTRPFWPSYRAARASGGASCTPPTTAPPTSSPAATWWSSVAGPPRCSCSPRSRRSPRPPG